MKLPKRIEERIKRTIGGEGGRWMAVWLMTKVCPCTGAVTTNCNCVECHGEKRNAVTRAEFLSRSSQPEQPK